MAKAKFARSVLVTNPANRYENQRFTVELEEEGRRGESAMDVYKRLEKQGLKELAQKILDYKHGLTRDTYNEEYEVVVEEYSLR